MQVLKYQAANYLQINNLTIFTKDNKKTSSYY